MKVARSSGTATTNNHEDSVAEIRHDEPTVVLLGRVAGGMVGHIGRVGRGQRSDLHLTLVIYDQYAGIFGFDGQPGFDPESRPSIVQAAVNSIIPVAGIPDAVAAVKIYTKYYRDVLPADIVMRVEISPPEGMAASTFASKLISRACGFANYKIDYSAPAGLVGETMVPGQYNSSSYMAGLLQSVMGYVPPLETPGFQTPGWEAPIPSSYFKDAPCA